MDTPAPGLQMYRWSPACHTCQTPATLCGRDPTQNCDTIQPAPPQVPDMHTHLVCTVQQQQPEASPMLQLSPAYHTCQTPATLWPLPQVKIVIPYISISPRVLPLLPQSQHRHTRLVCYSESSTAEMQCNAPVQGLQRCRRSPACRTCQMLPAPGSAAQCFAG